MYHFFNEFSVRKSYCEFFHVSVFMSQSCQEPCSSTGTLCVFNGNILGSNPPILSFLFAKHFMT